MQKVFLIGPRASGKSSLGRRLAIKLGYDFVDMDQLFVDTHKVEIAALVENQGWPAFRQAENRLLAAVSRQAGSCVVATGGGVVLAEANRDVMRHSGLVFYLAVPPEELARRLAADPRAWQRPSLTGTGLLEELAGVLAEREELYRQAAQHIIDAARPMDEALNSMASIVNELRGECMEKVAGYTVDQWRERLPLLEQIMKAEEVFWTNPKLTSVSGRKISETVSMADIDDAEKRLERFAPYLAKAFPETQATGGIIESKLVEVPAMQKALASTGHHGGAPGRLYLKCDSHLPISGSVKARGGIYEILKVAEDVALKNGCLSEGDDYAVFDSDKFKSLLSGYSIVVGSTGNLGLSIGIMSARLGFKVTVHMSADAKQWKKDMLRAKGATVIEYDGDYGLAVAAGRKESEKDPQSHFVDDENSSTLFLGYAVAAKRLQKQLKDMDIKVDADHPLFVYLPCGVGGAPGGIAFGLRSVFGDNVHCFFAEPTHSPAMLLGLMTGKHNEVSVNDFGLDNVTEADGLAVGRPSGFVGKTLEKDISGVFTLADERLYRLLKFLADTEDIFLEPSALAGFPGPFRLIMSPAGQQYIKDHGLTEAMSQASHIAWGTGGGMVPADIMRGFYEKGVALGLPA